MKQTRLMSLVESVANVIVGYGVAVVTQLVVFPWFGLPARLDDAMAIGAIFTIISILRSFLLRRGFEAVRVGGQFRDWSSKMPSISSTQSSSSLRISTATRSWVNRGTGVSGGLSGRKKENSPSAETTRAELPGGKTVP